MAQGNIHDKPCAHTKHDLNTTTWPVKPITSHVLTQNETWTRSKWKHTYCSPRVHTKHGNV